MRIYEGSPRREFEEALRSIGAFLDDRGMRDVLILEVPDGFVVQGIAPSQGGVWSESMGAVTKETMTFLDDDIARFLGEARAGRGRVGIESPAAHELALRVIGHWIDEIKPRDIFVLEQAGSYIVRVLVAGTGGVVGHQLAEFTADDIVAMGGHDASLRSAPPSGG